MSKRTIIIGDVHGCYEELIELLEKCHYDLENDRLIFLGDLINKGPYSRKVVNFVMEGGHECIQGNHERGFLNSLVNPQFFKRGFKKFFESYESKKERERVIEWMENLPLIIEDKDFICVHGGLQPHLPLKKQKPEIVTRIRTWGGDPMDMDNESDPPWYHYYQGDKLVIFGHWAMRGLVVEDKVVGLDTGCVWGGALSALILPEKKVVSVKAHQQYRDPNES